MKKRAINIKLWSIESDKTISWATLNSPFFISDIYFDWRVFRSLSIAFTRTRPELPPKKCLICRLFFFQLHTGPHIWATIADDRCLKRSWCVGVDVRHEIFTWKTQLFDCNFKLHTHDMRRTSNWTTRRWAYYSKLWLPIQLITCDKV